MEDPVDQSLRYQQALEGAMLDGTTPFVVDVGGHTGIDISHVHTKHPDLPAGSLILQDLPEVIAKVKVDSKIIAQSHDFFLPQPAKSKGQFNSHR